MEPVPTRVPDRSANKAKSNHKTEMIFNKLTHFANRATTLDLGSGPQKSDAMTPAVWSCDESNCSTRGILQTDVVMWFVTAAPIQMVSAHINIQAPKSFELPIKNRYTVEKRVRVPTIFVAVNQLPMWVEIRLSHLSFSAFV